MHAIAICELAGTAESAALDVARLVHGAPYDLRVALSGVLPRVILQLADADEAHDIARSLRAQGHGVVVVDVAGVVPGTEMVRVHRFTFDDAFFRANDAQGEGLAWAEIAAILVVARRVQVVRHTRERDARMPAVRPPPIEMDDRANYEHVLEHAAYLFPRARGSRPWILHEREAQYLGLGARMRLTRHENFREAVSLVRERAPGAFYDDRFAAQPRTATQLVHVRGHDAAVPDLSDAGVDLVVHVLAEWLLRGRGGPYREGAPR